jgi:hypothetical protein
MDIVFLVAAALGWAAVLGLAWGCERLQNRKATP